MPWWGSALIVLVVLLGVLAYPVAQGIRARSHREALIAATLLRHEVEEAIQELERKYASGEAGDADVLLYADKVSERRAGRDQLVSRAGAAHPCHPRHPQTGISQDQPSDRGTSYGEAKRPIYQGMDRDIHQHNRSWRIDLGATR